MAFFYVVIIQHSNIHDMQILNTSFFLRTTTLVLCLGASFSGTAQDQNGKPKFYMGVKASWLYCTPKVESSAPSDFILGGFDGRNGYDIGLFVGRNLGKRFQMNAQIGNSLQGRVSEGTRYNHFLLYSELNITGKVLHPISLEAGLRAGSMIGSDEYSPSRVTKPDFGYRLGIGINVFKNTKIHLDFMRSFNSFYKIGLPQGGYSVHRRNIGAGLSYAF